MKTLNNRFDTDEMVSHINEFKEEINFPSVVSSVEIQEIINKLSDRNILRMMGPDELAEYGVVLNQYALFLTIQENRYKAYLHYCESNIKYIVGRELQNCNEYGFEAKNLQIRSTNTTAQELETQKITAEIKLEYIKNISFKIQSLTESIRNLVFEKHKSSNLS